MMIDRSELGFEKSTYDCICVWERKRDGVMELELGPEVTRLAE